MLYLLLSPQQQWFREGLPCYILHLAKSTFYGKAHLYIYIFFIKYIYFPCMLHCHAAILHALFTNYMLFLSILYTFNILLSIYCALVIVPYY